MNQLVHDTLTLAQDGAAGIPGETTQAPDPAAAGANGTGGKSAGGLDPTFMFILFGAVILMFVFSLSGQRRERKKREAMLGAIKKHDQVQTVGGVIGAILELKPDFVVLKVDEDSNTRIRVARSAIQQVLSTDANADALNAAD